MIKPLHRLHRSASLARQTASPQGLPRRASGFLTTLLLIAASLLLGAASAQASHFRGASLTWKRLTTLANGQPALPNTVEVTVTESWRGDFIGSNNYSWGDNTGSFTTTGAPVIASGSDASGSYAIIRRVATHTYNHAGPFTISASSNARIAFVNSNQTSWTLQAVVDLRNSNQGSPVISSPIVLQMVQGGLNTVQLSFTDVDNDPVSFRMGTFAESGISTVATAGNKTLSVSSGGLLSWDTSSTLVNQLYVVHVVANDNHPGSPTGTSRVFFEFMIQIVDGTLNKPPVASGNAGPFVASIGVPFTNIISGTDPDGGTLKVTNLGLLSGASMSPVSGTSGPVPLNATFAWTPTVADADSSVGVTVVFTDPGGLTASKSFSISVPSNQPPVANAGPDVTVFDTDNNYEPTIVELDSSASSDPEGLPLTYSWTQIGSPTVTLTGPSTSKPTFAAPDLQNQTPFALTFRLSVSDRKTTRTDDVVITVVNTNRAPTAFATAPAIVVEGTAVILDGSGSSDPDGDALTYIWTQTSGTPVSLLPNGTNNPTLTFTTGVGAPHAIPGEQLEFALTVTDGIYSSTSAVVPVFIRNVNQAPLVHAGHDAIVFDTVGEVEIHVHAKDPDGDAITSYQWIQVAGPAVQIEHADEDHAHIAIPAVTPEQGSITLTFQVIVSDAIDENDAGGLSVTSNPVNITVHHANRAPVADAGQNKSVLEGTIVSLDGTGTYDPDHDAIASYVWTQIGGDPVALDTTNATQPTFSAPDVGPLGKTFTFQLVVTDVPAVGAGASLSSAPSTVVITVKYVNRPPTATVSTPQVANENSVVSLTGAGSDPDGNAFTFAWTQVSGPAVSLSDAASANPTFTSPAVDRFGATLVFALKTTDEYSLSSAPATTSVKVVNVNHAPIADAGESQSVPEDTAVTLAGLAADQDAEEQPLLAYAWQQTGGPAVTLNGADTLAPSFQAPVVTAGGDPLAKVTLKFKLTVTDPNEVAATDEVEVTVANVDHAPIANAGGAMIVNEAVGISLDGSLSCDPDGDALTYSWVQISGPAVALSNAGTAAPSFTAPFVSAAGATLKFKLTVDDGFGGTASDTATVSVKNINDPPTITGAAPSLGSLWPPDHRMVSISIAGVVDPNSNATITITGVTQDEPTNGLGDGDTAVDAIINADGTVLVRSERSGKGDGRVYRISFTAGDLEGSASGIVKVGVPHSKKSDAIKDSGGAFISTQ